MSMDNYVHTPPRVEGAPSFSKGQIGDLRNSKDRPSKEVAIKEDSPMQSPKAPGVLRRSTTFSGLSTRQLHGTAGPTHKGARIKNTGRRPVGIFERLITFVLRLSPSALLCTAAVIYLGFCFLFGLLFFALGEECFALPSTGWGFDEAMWLSVHTFSTVGYGSIYPLCLGGHLLVLLESFLSLIVTALIGGAIFFEVVRPRSRVRFSKNCLVDTHPSGGNPSGGNADGRAAKGAPQQQLTFRMVRESSTVLRDVNLRVQAKYLSKGPDGTMQSRRTELSLRSSYYNVLEQWQVYHLIDETSPLWALRSELASSLSGLEISLVAFDVAYNQEVRRFHAYEHADLVHGASFVGMVEGSIIDGEQVLEIRHDKIDLYQLHGSAARTKKKFALGRLFKLGAKGKVQPGAGGSTGAAGASIFDAANLSAPSPMMQALQASRKRAAMQPIAVEGAGAGMDGAGATPVEVIRPSPISVESASGLKYAVGGSGQEP